MQLTTKYFGLIDFDEANILFFRNGLFGFEAETQFLLLPFEESNGVLLCLQSIQTPELAFVVMDPFSLKPDYAPILQQEELHTIEGSCSEDLCFYVMCVVKTPISDSTVNLKCPIVINGQTHQAMQVILETEAYDMRHLLSEFQQKEGASSC